MVTIYGKMNILMKMDIYRTLKNGYNIKKMGDRTIPTKFEMIPADEEGKKLLWRSLKLNTI